MLGILLLASAASSFSLDGASGGAFSWEGKFRWGSTVQFLPDDSTNSVRIMPFNGDGFGTVWYPGDKYGQVSLDYTTKAGLKSCTSITGNFFGNGKYENFGNMVVSEELTYRPPNDPMFICMDSNIVVGDGQMRPNWFSAGPTKLWWYYKLFDGTLRLYMAYIGRNETDFDDGFNADWNVSDLVKDERFSYNQLPGKAALQLNYTGIKGLTCGATFSGASAIAGLNPQPDTWGVTDRSSQDAFRSFLFGDTVVGAKYAFSGPGFFNGMLLGAMLGLETPWSDVSLQFSDTQYHPYFGFGHNFGVTGLWIHGDMKVVDATDRQIVYGGIGVYYNFLPVFKFPLEVEMDVRGKDLTAYLGREISYDPLIVWTVIPDSLQIRVPIYYDILYTFDEMTLTAHPGIYWNPRKDGISDDPDHAFIILYNVSYMFQNPQRFVFNNIDFIMRVSF